MTNPSTARKTFLPKPRLTLADVEAAIRADEKLPLRKRQEVTSALRTLAKALDQPANNVQADPFYWRDRLAHFGPAKIGLSVGRWRNVQSLARFALDYTGCSPVGRRQEPLAAEWTEALALLAEEGLRRGLATLARYCSGEGILPGEVNDDAVRDFLKFLEATRLSKRFRSVHRTACLSWNRAVETVSGWPKQKVSVPNNKTDYIVPWETFPDSLRTDLEAYLNHLSGTNLLMRRAFKPLKPGSIRTRRRQMHEFLSGLVRRGHDAAALKTLKDVVTVDTVEKGLEFFLDPSRPRGPARKHASDIAYVLAAIAKHWVKVDLAHQEELKGFCRNLKVERTMTDKNRTRLRPFDDPEVARAFVALPQRIVADVTKPKSKAKAKRSLRKKALAIQTALAIELSIMVPMRRENLVNIEIGRHLLRTRKGFDLSIPAREVKNDVDIDAVLPARTVAILNLYMERHRPALMKEPSNWLFPGAGSGPKEAAGFGKQISSCIKRELGLEVNPHLFRHICAKIILDRQPGAYGLVRSVLGHKDVNSTTTYYAGMERAAAVKHYDAVILDLSGSGAGARPARAPQPEWGLA